MNDPNKVINVNLSSLLSLKAELLRKQTEVNKAKITLTNSTKDEEYTSHKQSNKQYEDTDDNISLKRKDKKKRAKEVAKTKDSTIYEHEDSVMLEKSRKVLEAKSKFYDRMQKAGGKLNSDDNCLVMFNKKKQEDGQETRKCLETVCSSSEHSDSCDSDQSDDQGEEWVEYTDCLGRTRTCLKSDLAEAKRKDANLAASMPERLDQTKANWMIDTMGCHEKSWQHQDDDNNDVIGPLSPTSLFGDGVSTTSKLEEQKVNWERKEQENLDKTDIHYQDVFFDEARQHGVGYYAFSTDEEERRKQQRELEKARQQTLEEQKRREALKQQRERIIAERVLAAKNRGRARLGLPPLVKDDNENKEANEEKPQETKEERKSRRKAEKLEKQKLKEEDEREKERLSHIRPWDKEKDGVPHKTLNNEDTEEWQYKPEREPMTQEQWNEYKRSERINEFAPPPKAPENFCKRTNFRSAANDFPEGNYNNMPPPENAVFSKFQSTKAPKVFKRRYCDEPDSEFPTSSNSANSGVCIPPPSNLEDFYLPSHNKKSKSYQELEKSVEAGLRFLLNNSDKAMAGTKSTWTAKADY